MLDPSPTTAVPWLRTAAAARVFVATERGLASSDARFTEAIEKIHEQHVDTPSTLSMGEKEAIAILKSAVAAPASPTRADALPTAAPSTSAPQVVLAPREEPSALAPPPVVAETLPTDPAPWLRSAAEARIFLASERELGTLTTARIDEAIATIRAQHANAPGTLSMGEREALAVLTSKAAAPASTTPIGSMPTSAPSSAAPQVVFAPREAQAPAPPAPMETQRFEPLPSDPAPWLRSAAQARVFLASERDRGTLTTARIDEAIATIRARHGDAMLADSDRRWREHFSGAEWYAPLPEPTTLTQGEHEALSLLEQARSR